MIVQMAKVHPDGVISVTNSAEILPVESKNGSDSHKLKNPENHRDDQIQCESKFFFSKHYLKHLNGHRMTILHLLLPTLLQNTFHCKLMFVKSKLTYSGCCKSTEHHRDDEQKQCHHDGNHKANVVFCHCGNLRKQLKYTKTQIIRI